MTLAEFQRLSDPELIEKVAVEVMGWKKTPFGKSHIFERPNGHIEDPSWNPLTDWNHTMQVVEKMTEDMGPKDVMNLGYMKGSGNQRTFCIAALLAVQ